MKLKILFGFIIVILIFIGFVKWIYGGTRETSFGAPENSQENLITFNKPMYYQIGEPALLTETFKKIGRQIVLDKEHDKYYPGRFRYENVATTTLFSIIDTINVANYGFKSIDSGTNGVTYYILQDEYGNKSFINSYRLNEHLSSI
jgi:hypothetical protein